MLTCIVRYVTAANGLLHAMGIIGNLLPLDCRKADLIKCGLKLVTRVIP